MFNIEESLVKEGVIWVGSDDGLVHVSQDAGETWTNVTPKGLPEAIINVVEPSPHDAASAYIAVAGYKMNDFTPYVYKTKNYGKSWEKIVNGIPNNTFARSVREDPDRKGLLYVGTENGMFVSFNDGANWQPLQNNLPQVPITDIRVKRKDLVVATQGRAIWILDDLTPLHQISDEVAKADYYLYKPRDYNMGVSISYSVDVAPGENAPSNLQITYVLNKEVGKDTPMSMEIMDSNGKVVYSEATNEARTACDSFKRPQLKRSEGAHVYSWNMRIGMFDCLKEVTATSRNLSAYDAAPGKYKAKLTIGDFSQTQEFELKIHPNILSSIPNAAASYEERDRLSASLFKAATEMAKGVRDLRQVQRQINFALDVSDNKEVKEQGAALNQTIEDWIAEILQKEMRTSQHNYQFEARLLIKYKDFLNQMSNGNIPVTAGSRDVTRDYLQVWSNLKRDLNSIKNQSVKNYNGVLSSNGLPEIYWPK